MSLAGLVLDSEKRKFFYFIQGNEGEDLSLRLTQSLKTFIRKSPLLSLQLSVAADLSLITIHSFWGVITLLLKSCVPFFNLVL